MTVFSCVLRHVAVQNSDRLEESRVSMLMATECIAVHNKLLRRKKYATWIEQFAIIWSIVDTEGGKERECRASAGLSSGNWSGILYTGVWVRLGAGMH
jgi:exopolysaccharide biosynthesis predicted pyruvyltransferase EpsI